MKKRLVIFFLAAAMVLGGCENKNSKLYKKGIEALEQKDYVTSIAMLEGAVKAGDRLAESYRSLGIAYLKSQEYDKAKEAFKSSLSSMKHKDAEFSRDVMYYEAETCVQAGDLDGAIEICTNIQEEKADADALFLRGRAYFLQKNYEQAKVDFDAAVETKESYQLCLDIYELYQESSMKADGDRYLEAAVKIEPKTTEDYYKHHTQPVEVRKHRLGGRFGLQAQSGNRAARADQLDRLLHRRIGLNMKGQDIRTRLQKIRHILERITDHHLIPAGKNDEVLHRGGNGWKQQAGHRRPQKVWIPASRNGGMKTAPSSR